MLELSDAPEYNTQSPSAQAGEFAICEHLLAAALQVLHSVCANPSMRTGEVTSKGFGGESPHAPIELTYVPLAFCCVVLYWRPQAQGLMSSPDAIQFSKCDYPLAEDSWLHCENFTCAALALSTGESDADAESETC